MEGKVPFKSEAQRIEGAPSKFAKRLLNGTSRKTKDPTLPVIGRIITLRITKEEHEAIKEAARIAGLSISEKVSINALCRDAVIERVNAIFHEKEQKDAAADK